MTARGVIVNAFEGVSRLILAFRDQSESPPPHGMSHVAKRVLILQLKIEDILGTLHRRMATGDSADNGTTDPATPSKPLKQNHGETRSTEQLGANSRRPDDTKRRRIRLIATQKRRGLPLTTDLVR